MTTLTYDFYARPTLTVARDLLGCVLVHVVDGQRVAGRIVETEAYVGPDDLACHGRHHRRTPRNAVMFGPPGFAYVYLTYGIHWMFNAVTEPEAHACAVLVRAVEPLAGQAIMAANRTPRTQPEWTSGPAKLTQAFGINGDLNGADLTGGSLCIEPGEAVPDAQVKRGPRIGLGKTPEPWKSIDWRLWVAESSYVSRPR